MALIEPVGVNNYSRCSTAISQSNSLFSARTAAASVPAVSNHLSLLFGLPAWRWPLFLPHPWLSCEGAGRRCTPPTHQHAAAAVFSRLRTLWRRGCPYSGGSSLSRSQCCCIAPPTKTYVAVLMRRLWIARVLFSTRSWLYGVDNTFNHSDKRESHRYRKVTFLEPSFFRSL